MSLVPGAVTEFRSIIRATRCSRRAATSPTILFATFRHTFLAGLNYDCNVTRRVIRASFDPRGTEAEIHVADDDDEDDDDANSLVEHSRAMPS